MSDSFIAILGCGFLSGIVVTLIIIGAIKDDTRHDYIDADMRLYIPSRDRDRSRDQSRNRRVDEIRQRAEKMKIKLGDDKE